MSCRLAPEDKPAPTAPLVLRQAARPSGTTAAGSDLSAEIARIEREWQRRAEEAREEGVRQGEAAGRSRASAELQPVIQRLAQAAAEISGLRSRLRREAEADMVQLAMAIARRVLMRELAIDPEALHGLVLGALEKLQIQEVSRIKVHPAHAPMISARLRENGAGNVEVTADPGSPPGTVVFETRRGNLDASIETQLQEIERGLADRLRRSP